MKQDMLQKLNHLINSRQVAAMGTLRNSAPQVSMVLYLPHPDFSAFYIHISQLAIHTQDLIRDNRVSLMISESESPRKNPQALARISINGRAAALQHSYPGYAELQHRYLARYPKSRIQFELSDFLMFRILPLEARYVAGFGKIYDLDLQNLMNAAIQK